MTLRTTTLILLCALTVEAKQFNLACDAVPGAASLAALDYSLIIGPTEYITLTYSVGTPALYTNKFGR